MSEPDLLIDTDVLIEILRGRAEAATWLANLGSQVVGIPVLVRMEILQGAHNRQDQQRLLKLSRPYPLIHLQTGDSERALTWFESYHLGHGVGIMDCLIAAIAVRLDKPLYTFNLKHYSPLPVLAVYAPYTR